MRRCIADFEPISGMWLSWPWNPEDWPGKLEAAQWAFVEFVRLVTTEVPVKLLVGKDHQRHAWDCLSKGLPSIDQVQFHIVETDRGWMRDVTPSYVSTPAGTEGVCWDFTAWAKYPNFNRDNRVTSFVCQKLDVPDIYPTFNGRRVVMEGGAFDVNGRGTLTTTRECLLHPDIQVRNPGYTTDDYEAIFHKYLGVDHIIWLDGGIAGDDTHGHVDDVARFVSPDTVLCAVAPPEDEDHDVLQRNYHTLLEAGLKVVTLPTPAVTFDGSRLPASYLNFVFLNETVLVPTFNDPNDALALDRIAQATHRRTIGVHAVDLVWGFGTLHCLSQGIPLVSGP